MKIIGFKLFLGCFLFYMDDLDSHLRSVLQYIKESNKRGRVVGAAIIDGEKSIYEVSEKLENGKIIHAERNAFRSFDSNFGDPSNDAWVITTLSPCVYPDNKRYGVSCNDLLLGKDDKFSAVPRFHTGYIDPLQIKKEKYEDLGLEVSTTKDPDLRDCCINLYRYLRKYNEENIDLSRYISKALKKL